MLSRESNLDTGGIDRRSEYLTPFHIKENHMAFVLITVQDNPDGSVDVRMNSEPFVQSGQADYTTAQKMAAVALNAIHGALQEVSPIVMTGESNKIFMPN